MTLKDEAGVLGHFLENNLYSEKNKKPEKCFKEIDGIMRYV